MQSKLPGIDDPTTVRSLERECWRRVDKLRLTIGPIAVSALSAGAFIGLVYCCFHLTGTHPTRTVAWSTMLVSIGIGFAVGQYAYRRLVLRVLPEVLRSHGRCPNCGYKLDESGTEKCPECGCETHGPSVEA